MSFRLQHGWSNRIIVIGVSAVTREIGLRLAIGALEHEVLLQFLIEAVVLSALDGVIGIVIATVASWGLSALMGVPYAFDPFHQPAVAGLFSWHRRAIRLFPGPPCRTH